MLPIIRNRLAGVAPFETIWDMQREVDRLLDNVWGRTPAEPSNWGVPADVVETEDEIRCVLEVPGVNPDDLNVVVENNVLTVSGEKKFAVQEGDEGKGTYHQERRYGRFDRSFMLPRNVDASRVSANYQNGVLTITLPKTEESKPRRVEIKAGADAQRITPAGQ